MTKHLTPTRASLMPPAAGVMYARQEEWDATEVLPWSDDWDKTVRFEFRRLLRGNHKEGYAGWKHIPGFSDVWDRAKRTQVSDDRWALEGRCGDFVPEFKRRLWGRGLPWACLSMITCMTPQGAHIVLGVETDRGTLICCNIQGCWPCDAPAFKHHSWLVRENPDGSWGDLRPIEAGTLESLMG